MPPLSSMEGGNLLVCSVIALRAAYTPGNKLSQLSVVFNFVGYTGKGKGKKSCSCSSPMRIDSVLHKLYLDLNAI